MYVYICPYIYIHIHITHVHTHIDYWSIDHWSLIALLLCLGLGLNIDEYCSQYYEYCEHWMVRLSPAAVAAGRWFPARLGGRALILTDSWRRGSGGRCSERSGREGRGQQWVRAEGERDGKVAQEVNWWCEKYVIVENILRRGLKMISTLASRLVTGTDL